MTVADPGWPEGYGRRVLDTVDSTLEEARRIAGGLSGPEWIMARHQTAARGRRGRPWQMPPGNFAATLVLRPPEPPGVAALRSFVAALALFDAVAGVCGSEAGLSLKWPNDVLLDDGKLAGILLESTGSRGQLDHLAIGIGVNLIAAPPPEAVEAGAVPPVALAPARGVHTPPEHFLTLLATAYARHESTFRTQGFAPIRDRWLSHAARLGATITARTATRTRTGRFADVDKDGNLVLETADGRIAIPAADVFF